MELRKQLDIANNKILSMTSNSTGRDLKLEADFEQMKVENVTLQRNHLLLQDDFKFADNRLKRCQNELRSVNEELMELQNRRTGRSSRSRRSSEVTGRDQPNILDRSQTVQQYSSNSQTLSDDPTMSGNSGDMDNVPPRYSSLDLQSSTYRTRPSQISVLTTTKTDGSDIEEESDPVAELPEKISSKDVFAGVQQMTTKITGPAVQENETLAPPTSSMERTPETS